MTLSFDVVAAAAGSALGVSWRPRPPAPEVRADVDQVRAAFVATAARLTELADAARADGADEPADILAAQALMAGDATFVEDVVRRMGGGAAPTSVLVREVAERHAAVLDSLDSDVLRGRAADVRQIGRMVVDELAGTRRVAPDGAFVLVDEEVTAPDLLEHADRLVGAVSVRGGVNSHAAIVARSLGVPLVVQAPSPVLDVADGTLLLVDADVRRLVVSPDQDAQAEARAVAADRAAEAAADRELQALPAETVDGTLVTLLANVASGVEARRGVEAGCDGFGLVRTELAFLTARAWPTRTDHEGQLAAVLAPAGALPVTVRLLDFTNDKKPPFADAPSLGLAGLLEHPWALDAQLTALVAVGSDVDLRVLVPMVTGPGQVRAVRERLAYAAGQLGAVPPPVGAMVETPEAVAAAPAVAAESDFLSIGTNDLTAAVLGLERTDPSFATAMTLHPTVLGGVEATVRAAAAAGVPMSVCGDAAADPQVLPVLIGAGVRSVSVSPSRLAAVRRLVRAVRLSDCVEQFERARTAESSAPTASPVRLGHAS
ncbi:MAG TPA: putative PEP-binding protein [Actinomycetes bacterium]|nr:putative PEP-binding protein [Actinomycetes bacterium]